MNFFEHQEIARKKTKRLVALYIVAVILIILLISLAVTGLFFASSAYTTEGAARIQQARLEDFFRLDILTTVAAVTILVITLGSFWKLFWLRGGGKVVAESLGGTLLHSNTSDPAERRLLNVVEEMALASGMSVPPVYVMLNETSINAFAAGFTPEDAVIGVTKGCMELLSRDELQGVIAHEYSHILNGDMRLNLRLIGILHGILIIALTGYLLIRFTSRTYGRRYSSRKGGDPRAAIFMLGVVLYVLGYIGVFFGRIIKSAVSRQREFLADASAVQFTRNPQGISGALAKIGGLVSGSRIEVSNAEEASHLFFSNGVTKTFLGMMATHPPLGERIARIDPSFTGVFPQIEPSDVADFAGEQLHSGFAGEVTQGQSAPGQAAPGQPAPGQPAKDQLLHPKPGEVKASIGTPTNRHLRYIQDLLASLPDEIRQATHEPFSAGALVFALLLDTDKKIAHQQLDLISKKAEPHVLKEVLRLEPLVQALPAKAKLPVVDMCAPALKELSPAQLKDFESCVQALIAADNKLNLFEYALAHSVISNLSWAFGKPKNLPTCRSIKDCREQLETILSALAWLDTREEATASKSFQAGAATLKGITLTLRPQGAANLQQLDFALQMVANADMQLREMLLDACIAVVLYDDEVTASEAELLRAVSTSLRCPMPPIL